MPVIMPIEITRNDKQKRLVISVDINNETERDFTYLEASF